jgi:hypothetical protein
MAMDGVRMDDGCGQDVWLGLVTAITMKGDHQDG